MPRVTPVIWIEDCNYITRTDVCNFRYADKTALFCNGCIIAVGGRPGLAGINAEPLVQRVTINTVDMLEQAIQKAAAISKRICTIQAIPFSHDASGVTLVGVSGVCTVNLRKQPFSPPEMILALKRGGGRCTNREKTDD